MNSKYIYIYIYAFRRRFYTKRVTVSTFYQLLLSNRTHDLGIASAMLY